MIRIEREPSDGYILVFENRGVSIRLDEAESDELFHELGIAKRRDPHLFAEGEP